MAFKLEGEVVIDARKGTVALKDIQREANKTSDKFKRAGGNTQKLGRSLLGLGQNAGRAGKSLSSLATLGAGGLFGAAVLGSINKLGETLKQASTDYYTSQKALSDAFATSFNSTSVQQAQAGLEKTEDTIESLRGKITQLGAFAGILEGIEKFTGLNLGVGDTRKALKDAQDNLKIQEEIVAARIKEGDILKGTESSIKSLQRISALNKTDVKLAALKGDAMTENVDLALEELRTLDTTTKALKKQLAELQAITGAKKNQEAIDRTLNILADNKVKKAQLELNLAKAQRTQKAQESKLLQDVSGGVLGASAGGRQALATARKQRERQLKTENFNTAEKIAPTQRDREKLAAQQAAGEMPSLAEKIRGGISGTDPSQLAREAAASKFEKDRLPFQGKGDTPTGKLNEEQSSLGKETLAALKALVDIMKSGTVVQ
jgi:hypothetical protein